MLWTNVKRMLRSGFAGFWRNGFISLTATLMMMVPLFILSSMIFSNFLLENELGKIEERVDINVYFVTSASEDSVLALKQQIDTLPEVLAAEYLSSQEVLDNFRERYKDDQLTLQALDELGYNPFGSTISIRAKEVSQYEGIAEFLDNHTTDDAGEPLIDNINYYRNKLAIGQLGDIIDHSRQEKYVQVFFLAAIAILVIFNTIRLAIYHSREEISVMRLVGARNSYIEAPFIIQGLLYGAAASIIILLLLFPVTYWFGEYFSAFPSLAGSSVSSLVFNYYIGNFFAVAAVVIGTSLFLSALSAFLAVRRYLSV